MFDPLILARGPRNLGSVPYFIVTLQPTSRIFDHKTLLKSLSETHEKSKEGKRLEE